MSRRVAFGIAHPNANVDDIERRLRTMREALPSDLEVTLEVQVPLEQHDERREWWGDSMLRFAMRVKP